MYSYEPDTQIFSRRAMIMGVGQKLFFEDLSVHYTTLFSELKNINRSPRYRDLKIGAIVYFNRVYSFEIPVTFKGFVLL